MAKILYGYGNLQRYGNVAFEGLPSSFGQVHIEHGYDGIASEAAYGDFYDAPGRSPGDDYSQPPFLIPLSVDVNNDPVALQALSLGISYAQAQGTDPAMAAKINDTVSAVAMWAAKLARAISSTSRGAALKGDADNWLTSSALFQDLGLQIVNGQMPTSRFPDWYQLGLKLQAQGNALANELGLPLLTIGGGFAPGGFNKAISLLKFLVYGGIAITGLYFGGQVLGLFKKRGK